MKEILSEDQKKLLRKAGLIVRECLEVLASEIKEGISTKELDEKAGSLIQSRNARPAFRGYKGYPSTICASRNNVVVHGIPKDTEILREGDIISIDIGVEYGGLFADAAKTFKVGSINEEADRLVSVTKNALYQGIKMARSGNHVQDISWAIQSFVESRGFTVVRAFVGHGIGTKIHAEPEVPNFGQPHRGMLLEDGMALAIEPMINAGTSDVEILKDGWTAITKDRRLSAHFEHTVIINGENPEIVT